MLSTAKDLDLHLLWAISDTPSTHIFNGIVQHFRKSLYLLCGREFDEKSDATVYLSLALLLENRRKQLASF